MTYGFVWKYGTPKVAWLITILHVKNYPNGHNLGVYTILGHPHMYPVCWNNPADTLQFGIAKKKHHGEVHDRGTFETHFAAGDGSYLS